MGRASEADWTMISIWGWTLVTVIVVLATALLALIILAIRYLLRRMKREAVEVRQSASQQGSVPRGSVPHHGSLAPEVTEHRDHIANGRKTTRDPSPVPPENPHAPPSSSAELTRPGY